MAVLLFLEFLNQFLSTNVSGYFHAALTSINSSLT